MAIDALRLCAGGYGCRVPAGAIGGLRLCAGGYGCRVPAWNGCRPAGSIRVLRPDAGCQLVLSGCWWFCAGGYGCSLPAVAIDALRLWAGGCGCSMERMQQASGGAFLYFVVFYSVFYWFFPVFVN